MTALASASYQCPTRNHLMVVCGMPYRYAVSVVYMWFEMSLIDTADGGERRRR